MRAQAKPSHGGLDASELSTNHCSGVIGTVSSEAMNGSPSPLPNGELGGLGGKPSLSLAETAFFGATKKGKAGFAFFKAKT